jgi:hypothetical protein
VYNSFFKDEIIADEINKNTQQGITPSTGGIIKGFPVHDPAERRIKEINKS